LDEGRQHREHRGERPAVAACLVRLGSRGEARLDEAREHPRRRRTGCYRHVDPDEDHPDEVPLGVLGPQVPRRLPLARRAPGRSPPAPALREQG